MTVIGVSLSEPHVNGTAMRAIYVYGICMCGTSVIRVPLHRLYTGHMNTEMYISVSISKTLLCIPNTIINIMSSM